MKTTTTPSLDETSVETPTFTDGTKNYLIDIDGTVCDDISNNHPELMVTATPFPDARETINNWFDEGHVITFFTSRTDVHREITETWLNEHGFNYHNLLMNKPRGGNYHWIDNASVQATRYNGVFSPLVKKEKTIEVFDDEK